MSKLLSPLALAGALLSLPRCRPVAGNYTGHLRLGQGYRFLAVARRLPKIAARSDSRWAKPVAAAASSREIPRISSP